VTYDDLLYLGVIALSYGLSTALHMSAFLAVFMAGLALFDKRMVNTEGSDLERRLLAFGERGERLVEVAMVLFIGAAMIWVEWSWQVLAYAACVLLIARPLSIWAVVRRRAMPGAQRRLVGWFGIRGVGSVFYLMYALRYGLDEAHKRDLISACLVTIAVSIVLHGMSATPLMAWYKQRRLPVTPPESR
jgi:NhaP-type Na+/H+ or K+/H+ antiporter